MKIRTPMGLIVLAATVAVLGGCRSNDEATAEGSGGVFGGPPRVRVPAGTVLDVRLASTISSETAKAGDLWTGVVTRPVAVEGQEVIPAGSTVEGVVVAAKGAERGSRASLELGLRAVRVNDDKTSLRATSEPVIAGSTRARNLGAIAGGAAAGALLGKAIGGDGDDAAKGALVGGAVATGAVAASKGYQVALKEGTEMSFSVSETVAIAIR